MPDSVKGLGYVAENCSYLFTTVYGLTKGVIGVKKLISCRVTLYKARFEWSYHLMLCDVIIKVFVYAAFHGFAYRTQKGYGSIPSGHMT